MRQQRGGIFQPQRLRWWRGAASTRWSSSVPLASTAWVNTISAGNWPACSALILVCAQQRAVVAEQGAGGRIGVDDLIGVRVEQQRRLDQIVEGEGAQVSSRGPARPTVNAASSIAHYSEKIVIQSTNFRVSRIFVVANIAEQTLRQLDNRADAAGTLLA